MSCPVPAIPPTVVLESPSIVFGGSGDSASILVTPTVKLQVEGFKAKVSSIFSLRHAGIRWLLEEAPLDGFRPTTKP